MVKIKLREVSSELKSLAAPEEGVSFRTSIGNEKAIGEIHFLQPEYLMPFSRQARRIFDENDISKLASSILSVGIRQPLTVIKSKEGEKFEIISGERRYRAALKAGLATIPCIIIKDHERAEEIALIENIQRQDLHPLEEARAYRHILDKHPQKEQKLIANDMGVNPSKISEALKLLDLPEKIQNSVIEHNISDRDTLRKLCSMKSLVDMESFLSQQTTTKRLSRNRPKKRNILNISICDGILECEFKSMQFSDEQKTDIIERLNSVINDLNS